MNVDPTRCAICAMLHDNPDFASIYLTMVCGVCGARAVNEEGVPPDHGSTNFHARGDVLVIENRGDDGDNPLFIDGRKCWRRYRFGGYITLRDMWDSPDLSKFYEQLFQLRDS